MSKSRRKTPIRGIGGSGSDKWSKVRAHRQARRAVEIALRVGIELPGAKAFGDPWIAPKDGKFWFGDYPADEAAKLARK